jgi:hypothetical protein
MPQTFRKANDAPWQDVQSCLFGYDASVMSLVNTNEDYLHLMGAASGSKRDSAAIGGLVSLWFGGFAIGICLSHFKLHDVVIYSFRRNICWSLCGSYREIKDDRAWLLVGHPRSSIASFGPELHLDSIRTDHRGSRLPAFWIPLCQSGHLSLRILT